MQPYPCKSGTCCRICKDPVGDVALAQKFVVYSPGALLQGRGTSAAVANLDRCHTKNVFRTQAAVALHQAV
jgi:hypothetical protein